MYVLNCIRGMVKVVVTVMIRGRGRVSYESLVWFDPRSLRVRVRVSVRVRPASGRLH